MYSLVLLPLVGCTNVKWSTTQTCTYGPTGLTTCTTSVTVGNGPTAPPIQKNDFEANAPESFTVIASAPASNFTVASNDPAQATFTAVTDTGYTASVTVNLQQVASTTDPVNPGDAVFTWAVVDSPQLDTWVQNVTANTSATLQLSGTSTLPLQSYAIPGIYTLSTEYNGPESGVIGPAESTINIPSSSPCGPDQHIKCIIPPTNS